LVPTAQTPELAPLTLPGRAVGLVRQLGLAVGSGGLLLAALALLVSLGCSVLALFTLYEAQEASQVYENRDRELRIMAFGRANSRLMHAIEGLSSGYRATVPGEFPVRDSWRAFDRALDDGCKSVDASVPHTEVLRQVCADRAGFRALVEPEILAFDPTTRPIGSDVWRRLQQLRDDVGALSDNVLTRVGDLEEEFAEGYGLALKVLAASAGGFALASAVLLFLLARSSMRYFAKWQEATQEHARLDSLVQSTGAPILLVDRNLRVLVGNREFHKLGLGLGREAANPFNLDLELLARWRSGPVSAELRQPVLYASDLLDPSGRRRLLNITATPVVGPGGHLQGIVFVAVDDTDRWQAQQALVARARYDHLTGLSNRSYFIESAKGAIEAAARAKQGFAMLCLDIDDFKDINSTMGYAIGDKLLKAAADRLRSCLAEGDLASRFGADEFTLLRLNVGGQHEADAFARRLLETVAMPYDIDGTRVRSTVSIGVSMHGPENVRAEVVVAEADMALNRAKAAGRNSHALFTSAIDREVRSRVRLVQEIRDGLAAGEFFLVYQPRVATETGRVQGVEALLRWRHPTEGELSPAAFISIAEASGLIRDLGLWVMRQACRQASLWRQAGLDIGRIAINVSALQFHDPAELESSLETVMAEAGLSPDRLEIELTETALVDVSREHSDLLQRLRARGIAIAIDDFGTGYSSLLYLRRLPVDRIKIAQEFIQEIAAGGANATVARVAVLLGRELGLGVVAEGVETPEQLERLKQWGCPEVQGFLFARPMSPEELVHFLTTDKSQRH
jgi:diguanylate cyclase (GGDEF)-like protein